ncbi:regulatory protein GemA [Erwinia psidii]|uniref:gp16 family protein n=1 Tax=Erwinia psidii TaxID=69224 RepID=UPI00226B367E|nr:regulatory protein GemA [Erwinia psidii]MCX8962157.1 regulatory protein GemA [Erwinia psidii]
MDLNRIKPKLIRLLHTGKTALAWDDETYRAVLARFTGGKTSSTTCTVQELEAVLEHMHQNGFPRQSRKHGRRPKVSSDKRSALSKIEALLADAGRPWSYAESMARRMFKQPVIEWLDDKQLTKLMQALIIDARRRNT